MHDAWRGRRDPDRGRRRAHCTSVRKPGSSTMAFPPHLETTFRMSTVLQKVRNGQVARFCNIGAPFATETSSPRPPFTSFTPLATAPRHCLDVAVDGGRCQSAAPPSRCVFRHSRG